MKRSLAANLVLNWVCPVLSFPERLHQITAAAMCTGVIKMFSNLVQLILSLSISYSYLIKFHKFRDFADNSQEGMKHQNEGCNSDPTGHVFTNNFGLRDPAPASAPSKTSRSGISWMGWKCPPQSVYLVGSCFFLWAFLFFPSDFFCGAHCFFSQAPFGIFFSPATLDTILYYFFGNSYLPLQPSYRPSSYQPIYLHHFAHPSFMLAFPSMYCMCIE